MTRLGVCVGVAAAFSLPNNFSQRMRERFIKLTTICDENKVNE